MRALNHTLGKKTISISLLGGFSLQADGITLTDDVNRSLKLWSVLAYLTLHRDRPVSQTEFIEIFWPDDHSANPINAMKTLLYRIRTMLEPLFGPDIQPILTQRGAYIWNPAVNCLLDVDRFENLCLLGGDTNRSPQERMEHYREATRLYKGDLLPKLSHELWLVPLSVRYHERYVAAVRDFAALLEQAALYDEMQQVCARASALDNLNEELHTLVVRALLRQGKEAAALERYEKATDLLYRNLGVRPSKALRALYEEIMAADHTIETNLEVIMEDLRETDARTGAFVCEYGFFREACRLEARRITRSGICVHLCLITVCLPDGGVPALDILSAAMDQLLEVLVHNLRRGDVVCRYSGAQYVILLPAANYEDSGLVMERVVQAFYRVHQHSFLKLNIRVRALELTVPDTKAHSIASRHPPEETAAEG